MKYIYYPDDIEGAEDIEGQIDANGNRHDVNVGEAILVEDHAATKLKSTFPFLELLTEKAWANRNDGVGLAGFISKEEAEVDVEDDSEDEPEEASAPDSFNLDTANYPQLQAKAKELGIKANQKPDALREQIAEALK
jgi:hypothetical protein